MLFEIKGICMHCAESVNLLLHNGEVRGACPSCGNDPFDIAQIAGIVYVVKNENQIGVKIGQTTKTVEQRAKSLSSTGVPGKFYPIAIFPSSNPKKHEAMAHSKLAKKRIEKEHFNLEPVDAALGVYRALNRKIDPIFYCPDIQKQFNLHLEKARIEMEIKLNGRRGMKK